jgi:regulator of RNase E activity RraB
MSDRWEYYPCAMGGAQASILVDVGISEEIGELPPHLLRLRIPFRDPVENGMPSQDEYQELVDFEDQLMSWLGTHQSTLLGRVSVQGHRHFLIATPEPDETTWGQRLVAMQNELAYEIAFLTEPDGVEQAYWEELFPSADDWQVIKDLRVLETLRRHGDDETAVRTVEHWAYFPIESAAEDFSSWAKEEGYHVDPAELQEDGQYCVHLSHDGTVELPDITSHTIRLHRQVDACGGEYDGWATAVVSGSGLEETDDSETT